MDEFETRSILSNILLLWTKRRSWGSPVGPFQRARGTRHIRRLWRLGVGVRLRLMASFLLASAFNRDDSLWIAILMRSVRRLWFPIGTILWYQMLPGLSNFSGRSNWWFIEQILRICFRGLCSFTAPVMIAIFFLRSFLLSSFFPWFFCATKFAESVIKPCQDGVYVVSL